MLLSKVAWEDDLQVPEAPECLLGRGLQACQPEQCHLAAHLLCLGSHLLRPVKHQPALSQALEVKDQPVRFLQVPDHLAMHSLLVSVQLELVPQELAHPVEHSHLATA